MSLIEKFARVLKLAAMVSIALVIFAGCNKDEDNLKTLEGTTYTWVDAVGVDYIHAPSDIHFVTKTKGDFHLPNGLPERVFNYTYNNPNVSIGSRLGLINKDTLNLYFYDKPDIRDIYVRIK